VASPRKSGIHAVAARAGVSIATVSRVMAGSTSVNENMADRVRTAAAELGYRPNPAARGLASGLHRTIGVVVPDITNPYFSHVMQAVSVGAAANDYRLVVGDSRLDPEEEPRIVANMTGQVDALVLIAPRMSRDDLKKVAAADVPSVMLNRIELGIDMPMVAVDNFAAMLELCQHLASLGHSRVVYLAGPEESWQNRERWRAVRQAKIMGLQAELVETDGTLESGHDVVERALAHEPTALIGFNDLVAIGAIARLRELGLGVPSDISVTGFDDSVLARFNVPALTTAKSPMDELGESGWQLLQAVLDGKDHDLDESLLAARVVLRASSGDAPSV
jgi:LacI family transcriptional regulator